MEVYLRCFPSRCYLYKKKYEVCVTCGKLGHRADVCPNPDDVRCRGCGAANPESNHSCEPRCLLCKKAHLLGDNKCREIYRMPYIIKKRLWEKKMEQEKLQAQAPTQGEPQASKSAPIEENRGRARDATSDQAGQQSRERSISRAGRRSSSWFGGGCQQNPAKGPADQGRGPANQGRGPGLPPRDPKDPWGKKKKEENIHSVSFGSKGSQAEKDEISLLKKEIEEQKKENMSADWPDPGPDGSSDFCEDQFRLGNANSLGPAAPYDADRQRALLEGPFHRAPVQQLSLTCPTNDPAPCSILASCSTLWSLYKDYATITWTVNGRLLKNLIDRSTLSTVKNDGPVKVSKIAINQLERLRSDNGKFIIKATIALGSIFEDTCTSNAQREPRGASCSEGRYLYMPSEPASVKSKHLTCRTAAGLG
ncbi:hypothetical protein HPB49_008829 [Dermacentor silvarum]|uniref:Uncharacterized protein n=1 Tax=Dermacentor silvarum TaxID=543639 RepID=A0ACB8DNL2_DERSI|nr:hypothetical protein HPB49_008829 [Dermacentor silvarum]